VFTVTVPKELAAEINSRMYCICMKLPSHTANILTERVICFISTHPFYELFCYALYFINNTYQLYRLLLLNNSFTDNYPLRIKEELEALTKVPFITEQGKEMLEELYKQKVEYHKDIVIPSLKGVCDECRYKVPTYKVLRHSVIDFFCLLFFDALNIEQVYQILCALLLEKSILFVSENLNLLTSSVYFFIMRF